MWSTRHRVFLIISAAVIAAAFLIWKCERDPNVNFLPGHRGAEWIVFPTPPEGHMHRTVSLDAVFRREFTIAAAPRNAELRMRAARSAVVKIDGIEVELKTPKNWKDEAQADIGRFLRSGRNTIEIKVTSDRAPPALWLLLSIEQLKVATDTTWDVSFTGSSVRRAVLASTARLPANGNLLAEPLTTFGGMRASWPLLAFFVAIAVAASVVLIRSLNMSILCGLIATLWLILFYNNSLHLPFSVGFDSDPHLSYIRFIQERHALPLPAEGFEMFQPPLYYLVSAGALSLLHLTIADEMSVFVLRVLTLLFGVAHLAVVFLTLRLLRPNDTRFQAVGLIFAAFLPMQIYMSHFVTNETLAATLISAAIYLALRLLIVQAQSSWPYVWLGVVVGAAMLTKATAILLLPLVLIALAISLARQPAPIMTRLGKLGTPLLVCITIGGWPYLRVGWHSDSPFLGWAGAFSWWQDPGYHTAADYWKFGQSLVRPLFSAFARFWDGIYSTLWGDGSCGGAALLDYRLPWNYQLMLAGYLLALIPSLLIVIGLIGGLREFVRTASLFEFLIIGFAGTMLVALLFMSINVASYAQIKAFFALSTLSGLAVFAATGWKMITRQNKWIGFSVVALLLVWAINSYASFWITPAAARLYAASHWFYEGEIEKAISAAQPVGEADRRNMDKHPAQAWLLDQAALERSPNEPNARAQLAFLYSKQHNIERAITEVREAIRLGPDDEFAHGVLLEILFDAGRTEEFIAAARDALAVTPFRSEFHQMLSEALERNGDAVGANEQANYAELLKLPAPTP